MIPYRKARALVEAKEAELQEEAVQAAFALSSRGSTSRGSTSQGESRAADSRGSEVAPRGSKKHPEFSRGVPARLLLGFFLK